MEFEKEWSPGDISKYEGPYLKRYHEKYGGLLFVEVNVAFPIIGSRKRQLDGVLIKDPPKDLEGRAYHYTSQNKHDIKKLVENYSCDLIEVHNWGFYGFGQIIGKADIIKREWNPKNINKVFIPSNKNNKNPYFPEEKPDPATHKTFKEYNVKVEILD